MFAICNRHPGLRPVVMCVASVAALLVSLTAFGATVPAAKRLFPDPVYVTLQGSGAVENLATGATWNGLAGAHYDALGPARTRLLVSSATTPDAYLVNTLNGQTLATFDIGPVLQGVAIDPDGKWGPVASTGDGTVSVINLHTDQLVKTIPVGMGPNHAAVGSGPHNAERF